MKNIIADKDNLSEKFADAVFTIFKQVRFGISSCSRTTDINRLRAVLSLANWQSKLESNIVNETDVTIIADMPAFQNSRPFIIGGLNQSHKTTVHLEYTNEEGETIEVDSDGCKTTIIVPPSSSKQGFEFVQGTPLAEWTIAHNLGFIPNVRIENLNGENIDGIVTVVNINTIQINFSSATAGKAYLS